MQDNLLKFKQRIRTNVTWLLLRFSQTADLLGFSKKNISRVYRDHMVRSEFVVNNIREWIHPSW